MRGAQPTAALTETVLRELPLGPDETIVVALSGGPDSVALASLVVEAAAAAQARVVLAHVNHGVRASAWQDEAVVLAVGSALSQPGTDRVRVAIAQLESGPVGEARLRYERYAALVRIAREHGAARIATAHHARDQTETVLLALFRGTGPDGLAGIAPERAIAPGIALVRPLLRVDPLDLRAYCAWRRLPFVLDPSNADTQLRRNAVRALLEGVRPLFPGLDEAVARCAQIAYEEREGRPRATLRRRLRAELRGTLGETSDLSFERLDALARALENGRGGRHFVRRGVEVIVE